MGCALPVPETPPRWRGRDLACADLRGEDLRGADLSEADLAGACLAGADLRGATLFRADLTDAELLGARLDGASLEGCVAHRVGLGSATLDGASLFEADLTGASLTRASLRGADLRASTLDGARLIEADLEDADLERASLRECHLEQTRLAGARFDRADLRGATFRGARGFERGRFVGADVRGADFNGAYLLRRFVLDQNYLEELRTRDRWHALVYWVWWATSDCGRSLSRWSAWIVAMTIGFGVAFAAVPMDYGDHRTWLSPFYYSAVTLTTLGYGDVLPASEAGQWLAMLEVFTGYVMLGGLLSIFANKMARRAD